VSSDHETIAELLEAATAVFIEHGFATSAEFIGDTTSRWLVAENDLFIVGVTATVTMGDLRALESIAAGALLTRLSKTSIGTKKWDAYLVLMTTGPIRDAAEARQLVSIEYDTGGVRRLVATSVAPTPEGVRHVLRPFVPLPPPQPGAVTEAFEELVEQLHVHGIDRSEAARIVSAFKDRGDLDLV